MVYEDQNWLAFLDVRPLFFGHVLVIPRGHVRTVMELPDSEAATMMLATKRISLAVQNAMKSDGIFVASNNGVSQSVDHLHIHVVPRNKKDGLRGFMWPRLKYPSEEMMYSTAGKIAAFCQ